jgi:hypothetical protein
MNTYPGYVSNLIVEDDGSGVNHEYNPMMIYDYDLHTPNLLVGEAYKGIQQSVLLPSERTLRLDKVSSPSIFSIWLLNNDKSVNFVNLASPSICYTSESRPISNRKVNIVKRVLYLGDVIKR